jgi:branched-chain amino acid transport system permease protein
MEMSNVVTIVKRTRPTGIVLLLCIIFLTPLLNKLYLNTILITIGFYSMVTMGFILLMGFAGQISLGQAIFFGLGAYISGILAVNYNLSPWLTLIMATFATGCIAMLLGRVIFKLRGLIVGGITLALNLVFYNLVLSVSEVTGGATGMMNIPRLPSGGLMSYSLFIYYITWIAVFLLLIFSLNLVNSRSGRALKAMNLFSGGSDVTAQVMGINIMKYKAGIFAVSAMYASLAGSIYAHYISCIEPATFGVSYSVMIAIMAILGGLSSPWGALLGASLLVGITELLREIIPLFISGNTGAYELIAYGIILMATLRFLPHGMISVCRGLTNSGEKGGWKAILLHSRIL